MAAAAAGTPVLLLSALFFLVCFGSGNSKIPTAVNITWSSINFKTILQWEPKPINYVYTVEIDGTQSNRKKTCIHTTATECDVTNLLQDTRDKYIARIYSEPLQNDEDNLDIPDYEVSPEFTPYTETEIGVPRIKTFEQIDKILKVEVEDAVTPYTFENGRFKTLRDIFNGDLEYTLYYWKDQSTGKKSENSKSNQFEVSIDRGKNYCFYVQATIPSRVTNRSSQKSIEKCTSVKRGELDDFSLEAILIITAVAVGILVLIIIFSVVVYKCTRQKTASNKKENVPLNV